MIILSLHTTTPYLGAAITDGAHVLAEKTLPSGKRHLENFPDLVSDVLEMSDISLRDVEAFSAAIGPGSFSGVRIGLAAVKGYCLGLNKPIIGISSLDILIRQASHDQTSAIAVIDAGRGDVYAGHAGSHPGNRPASDCKPVIVPLREFPQYARKLTNAPYVICGGSIIDQLGMDHGEIVLKRVEIPSPSICGFLAHERLINSDVDDLYLLTPLYMRKSDAEEKNRGKTQNDE